MFQFLIGRLATIRRSLGWMDQGQFQFLIGRLATGYCRSNLGTGIEFQFLIGRLATCLLYTSDAADE